jgi:long-chain acyl-CoA synthetase
MGRGAPHPEVYKLIREEVERVNATLPPQQRIRKFLLLYKELDADDGELTRTKKVRRGVIAEKYGDIIDAIYSGAPHVNVDTIIHFQDGSKQRVVAKLTIDEPRTEFAGDQVQRKAAE